jgi:hypothetical protein
MTYTFTLSPTPSPEFKQWRLLHNFNRLRDYPTFLDVRQYRWVQRSQEKPSRGFPAICSFASFSTQTYPKAR